MRESLDRLRDQLSTRDGQHLYRLDHIFHRAVAAATQNRLLYRECELLLDHYLRFEVKSVYNNSIDAKIVFDEHVAICDAIAEGSAERAEQAMARHLTNSTAAPSAVSGRNSGRKHGTAVSREDAGRLTCLNM